MISTHKTKAYRKFQAGITTTRMLLDAATFGVAETIRKKGELTNRFSEIKSVKGRIPKGYKPDLEIKRKPNSDNFEIRMDDRMANLMKKVLLDSRKYDDKLKFYFNAIILVYIWGLFETYIILALEEAFRHKPEMLKSNESISYKEVIENHSNIIEHLVNKQTSKLGHNTLIENLDFLNKRINLNLKKPVSDKLQEIYLIRNIVAHSTGIVRDELVGMIPKKIRVKDKELSIPREYVDTTIRTLSKSVDQIESEFIRKIFKNIA